MVVNWLLGVRICHLLLSAHDLSTISIPLFICISKLILVTVVILIILFSNFGVDFFLSKYFLGDRLISFGIRILVGATSLLLESRVDPCLFVGGVVLCDFDCAIHFVAISYHFLFVNIDVGSQLLSVLVSGQQFPLSVSGLPRCCKEFTLLIDTYVLLEEWILPNDPFNDFGLFGVAVDVGWWNLTGTVI